MHQWCEDPQLSLDELAAKIGSEDEGMVDIEDLRVAASHCPACILAALRHTGKFAAFDFKKECALFWDDHRESPMARCGY